MSRNPAMTAFRQYFLNPPDLDPEGGNPGTGTDEE